MTKDEKTQKASNYMKRLVKKIEQDECASLSYAEKQKLGMFGETEAYQHIGEFGELKKKAPHNVRKKLKKAKEGNPEKPETILKRMKHNQR